MRCQRLSRIWPHFSCSCSAAVAQTKDLPPLVHTRVGGFFLVCMQWFSLDGVAMRPGFSKLAMMAVDCTNKRAQPGAGSENGRRRINEKPAAATRKPKPYSLHHQALIRTTPHNTHSIASVSRPPPSSSLPQIFQQQQQQHSTSAAPARFPFTQAQPNQNK